jgi:hypothetical protein
MWPRKLYEPATAFLICPVMRTRNHPPPAKEAPPRGAFMALDRGAQPLPPRPGQHTGPLSASLRWGLGWTVIAATLAAAGCASATSVDDPADIDHTTVVSTTVIARDDYASCVAELGGSPDAIEHHIDACEAARRAR